MRFDNGTAKRLLDVGTVALVESSAHARLLRGFRLVCGDGFAGRAVTAELPAGDNLGIHLALERAEVGDVVCVGSAGGGLYGVVGELLAESGRASGIAAFVVDDGARDVAALVAPPAIAARGISGRGTLKQRVRRGVGADVSLGGALVRSGDWILGDPDGISLVAAKFVGDALERAEQRIAREDEIRIKLGSGVSTRDVFGLREETTESIS